MDAESLKGTELPVYKVGQSDHTTCSGSFISSGETAGERFANALTCIHTHTHTHTQTNTHTHTPIQTNTHTHTHTHTHTLPTSLNVQLFTPVPISSTAIFNCDHVVRVWGETS